MRYNGTKLDFLQKDISKRKELIMGKVCDNHKNKDRSIASSSSVQMTNTTNGCEFFIFKWSTGQRSIHWTTTWIHEKKGKEGVKNE